MSERLLTSNVFNKNIGFFIFYQNKYKFSVMLYTRKTFEYRVRVVSLRECQIWLQSTIIRNTQSLVAV